MRTITTEIFKFNELDDTAKGKARDYIRNNWHDLGQHCVDEMIDSLKALAKETNGTLDYSLSIVPDRGEYVTLKDYNLNKLADLIIKKDECPLTGMCYDIDVIEGLSNGSLDCAVLKTLHAEGEYIYGDEGIDEMLTANEYEFTEEGKMV